MSGPLVIGIDIGTSGTRALAMNSRFEVRAQAAAPFDQSGGPVRDPAEWWNAVSRALAETLNQIDPRAVRAIAVDGTSGTVLPVDGRGTPLAEPLMYNDAVSDRALPERIGRLAPADSAAHGPTSGLVKALTFLTLPRLHKIIHQADWIAGRFSGRFDLTDENNALKTGYDPVARRWPDWIEDAGLPLALLPEANEPGTAIGTIAPEAARTFGIPAGTLVVAGTTDGCASFLATGAAEPGDGVTALGSTMTLKLLSDKPVFAPEHGIYSHRIGDAWLAGGASNSGGRVLAQYFTVEELQRLSARIDTTRSSGLDYYPLPAKGERFPVADLELEPQLAPRPPDDVIFLQGMLEGIAAIERLGYERLAALGAPRLRNVRTVGGGARNAAWSTIRQSAVGVPFLNASSTEAAAGVARLALKGAISAGAMS